MTMIAALEKVFLIVLYIALEKVFLIVLYIAITVVCLSTDWLGRSSP